MTKDKGEKRQPKTRNDARWAALHVLGDLREGRQTASASIETLIERSQLGVDQRSLTTELVMGAIRHRITLASVLGKLTSRGWEHVGRRLQHILMIGAYQLIWLDRIPAFAAVNEAVNQAKADGGPAAGRFVNAILRSLLRAIVDRRAAICDAKPTRMIAIDRELCCTFDRDVLPDPSDDFAHFLSESTSVPIFLVRRWIVQFGRVNATEVCQAATFKPPVILRPNSSRTNAATLIEVLSAEGIAAEPVPAKDLVCVVEAAGLTRTEAFKQGLFQPQDPTAVAVIDQMHLKAGQVVLDICAGLGTKSMQIAEAVGEHGVVLACDVDETKLAPARENASRLGHNNIRTSGLADLESLLDEVPRIDWILIDAPCSNSGVLARRPEARYRISAKGQKKLAATQIDILETAANLAQPGTRLMYSTCSIDADENERVCQEFAKMNSDWRLSDTCLTLPSAGVTPAEWCDGGFRATWERGKS